MRLDIIKIFALKSFRIAILRSILLKYKVFVASELCMSHGYLGIYSTVSCLQLIQFMKSQNHIEKSFFILCSVI